MKKFHATCMAGVLSCGIATSAPSFAADFEVTGFVEPEVQVFQVAAMSLGKSASTVLSRWRSQPKPFGTMATNLLSSSPSPAWIRMMETGPTRTYAN